MTMVLRWVEAQPDKPRPKGKRKKMKTLQVDVDVWTMIHKLQVHRDRPDTGMPTISQTLRWALEIAKKESDKS
jgi:hypothetical protein